jgi:hypothetical protein
MTELIATELPNPAGAAPLRRPHSVRRTTSIDVTWPRGGAGDMLFEGAGRDCYTGSEGAAPTVMATDTFVATLQQDRTIVDIDATPPRANIKELIGARGGGYLRQKIAESLVEEHQQGTLLYQLLDDLSGTSLIAGWAWSRWPNSSVAKGMEERVVDLRSKMEGVCIGFRPGSSALDAGAPSTHRASPVVSLINPQDPQGWHSMPDYSETSMRRARRIDVWLDGDIHIDAAFQDSATAPEGGRIAVHEYGLQLTVDAASGRVKTIGATPHVLPFPECPSAVGKLQRLQSAPVSEFRSLILDELAQVEGCTHLNDALRALADVPQLIEALSANR